MLVSRLNGPPYDIELLPVGRQGCEAFLVLGGDENGTFVSAVFCSLELTPTDPEMFWEFSFDISVTYDNNQQYDFRTQDRNVAIEFIPGSARPHVMDVVRSCLLKLADYIKPPGIFGVTIEQHPTGKCLDKYRLLIEALQNHGYLRQNDAVGTNSAGQWFWRMQSLY
jgi:hypothetical protein